MVRGKLSGNEIWKTLLKVRIKDLVPKNGGPWQPGLRWTFLKGWNATTSRAWEDKFFNAILRAWYSVKEGLEQRKPRIVDEWDRQSLCWNPIFKTGTRCLLGMRPCVAWGPFETGVATTLKQWKFFCSGSGEKGCIGSIQGWFHYFYGD